MLHGVGGWVGLSNTIGAHSLPWACRSCDGDNAGIKCYLGPAKARQGRLMREATQCILSSERDLVNEADNGIEVLNAGSTRNEPGGVVPPVCHTRQTVLVRISRSAAFQITLSLSTRSHATASSPSEPGPGFACFDSTTVIVITALVGVAAERITLGSRITVSGILYIPILLVLV